MIIDLPRFIATERPSWTELEKILDRLDAEPIARLTHRGGAPVSFPLPESSPLTSRGIATFASEPELRRYLETLVGARLRRNSRDARARAALAPGALVLRASFPRAFRRSARRFMSLVDHHDGRRASSADLAVTLDDEAKESGAAWAIRASHLGDPAEARGDGGEGDETDHRRRRSLDFCRASS